MILFNNLDYGKFADIVNCTYCGSTEMAVPSGTEKCPVCGKNGCLMWTDKYFDKDANSSEIEVSDIANNCEIKEAAYIEEF